MTSSTPGQDERRRGPNRKFIVAGMLVGAAAGAWAGTRARPSKPAAPTTTPIDTQPMIDWEQARSIAINLNRGETLTETERARLDTEYRALVERCLPIVGGYMGVDLPQERELVFTFDRVDWVNANLDAFKSMLSVIEALNPAVDGEQNAASRAMAGASRKAVSAELGVMLGYIARRVLGQYDVALLGREPVSTGSLFFVEPNIRSIEQSLTLPADEFRLWLALHETTHAFQFEAYPWVKPHFNQMLERYFDYLKQDAEQLRQGMRGLKALLDRTRTGDTESWIQALMTPEQRILFDEMQAMMSIIEGYSNHVMNAVGADLMPSYDSIRRKFEYRQANRSTAEQLFAKLTGLDMKMEQYRQGQRFIDQVVAWEGHDVARLVWQGPEYLPTLPEIREPERWVSRITGRVPNAGAPTASDGSGVSG